MPPAEVDGYADFGEELYFGQPGTTVTLGPGYGNRGATAAQNALLTATLEPDLTYEGDTLWLSPLVSGNQVTWHLPDQAFLDARTFLLYLGVPDSAARGTRYAVTLEFSSAGPEANPADNTESTEVVVAWQIHLPLVLRKH